MGQTAPAMFKGQYNCKGSAKAGILGAFDGVFAMSGLSGRNNPFFQVQTEDNKLRDLRQLVNQKSEEFTNFKFDYLHNELKIIDEEQKERLEFLQAKQKLRDYEQDVRINYNSIFIYGLMAGVFLLFVYDLFE